MEDTSLDIQELMHQRGFTLLSTRNNHIQSYGYADLYMTPRVVCDVNTKTKEFRFRYARADSINFIETPRCSPVTNEEHF